MYHVLEAILLMPHQSLHSNNNNNNNLVTSCAEQHHKPMT